MFSECIIVNFIVTFAAIFFDAILYFLTRKDERNYKDSRVA